jgi:cytochrome c
MNKKLIFGIILIIIVAALGVISEQMRINNQKEEISALVDKAVIEIETKGEAAFPQFNTTEWYHDDRYVFVWRMDGIRVIYPPSQ